MTKIDVLNRIQKPLDTKTIEKKVDYALNNGFGKGYNTNMYLFSLPYPRVPIYKQPYENPDAQLEDICELPINHQISIETARQAKEAMNQIIDKTPDEIRAKYTIKHNRVITFLGARYGFRPVLSDVRKYIYQIGDTPVLDPKGVLVDLITLHALGAYESISSNLGEGEEKRVKFWRMVGLKGLWPSGVIFTLSRKKKEESIDLFIDYFSRTEKLNEKGVGQFTYSKLNQMMNFPFVMEYLITNFGIDKVKNRFRQESRVLGERLLKLFDFYRKESA